MDVVGIPASQVKAKAFIVGVDKDRKAPGLKLLGLEDGADMTAHSILSNKEVQIPFKTVRAVPSSKGLLLLVGMGDVKALTQEKVGTLANLGCRAAGGLGLSVVA